MSELEKQKRRKELEEAANKLLGQKPLSGRKQVFESGNANKKQMKLYKKKIAKQLEKAGISYRKPKK